MKNFIKKIALITFLIFLLLGVRTFAQSPQQPVSSLTLSSTSSPPVINITITGNEPTTDVEFFLKQNEGEQLIKIGDAPLLNSTISINVEYLIFQYPFAYNANDTEFESVVVKTKSASGQQSDILQSFNFADLLPKPAVTVDFPGWASSENLPGWVEGNYCKKADKEEYYPCLITDGDLIRTPASAPLYIILIESRSGEKALLKTIPGGASSFRINTLTVEESVLYGGLSADRNYDVYIASDAAGVNPVDFGNSTTTYKTMGSIPAPSDSPVSVTKAEIKTTSEGKKYFEVSGVVNKTVRDRTINLIVRKATATSGGELIGRVPYNQGSTFNVPDTQTLESLSSLEDGSYNLVFSQTVPPGIPEDFQTYSLPVVGAGTGNGTGNGGAGNGNPGTGAGINPYISPDQQKILDEGIVPVDCGYTDPVTGKHKLCGFPQLIELIHRAIQYIFVLMLPITAIVFAYAGFLFLTSGGNVDRRNAAKRAMTNVIIGIIIILAAFLVVRTILLALGVDTSQSWVFLNI